MKGDTKDQPTEKLNTSADVEAGVHDGAEAHIDQEDTYLHGLPLVLMTLSLMIGVLMISLDTSIIGMDRLTYITYPTNQVKRLPSRK